MNRTKNTIWCLGIVATIGAAAARSVTGPVQGPVPTDGVGGGAPNVAPPERARIAAGSVPRELSARLDARDPAENASSPEKGASGPSGDGTPRGGVPANNDCINAASIGEGVVSYSTLGATTDGPVEPLACAYLGYDQIDSDIWFRYTASCSQPVTISLCGSDFDTKLAVYSPAVCPPASQPAACNDDFCGIQSQVTFPATMGQDYLVRVGGYRGASGSGVMSITCAGGGCAACPPGAAQENEPDCGIPTDTVNGGCNSVPPVYTPISCGESYCGTLGAGGGLRDTDWYELVLAQPTTVTWSAIAEAPLQVVIVTPSPDCGNLILSAEGLADTCQSAITSQTCLPAGTHWLFVSTQQGIEPPCATPYWATAVCQPCGPIPTGACCLPGGSCLDAQTQEACFTAGGVYQGDGSLCFPGLCSESTGACCVPGGSCLEPVTELQCFGIGGAYQGNGVLCQPGLCPVGSGACCLPDGNCLDGQTDQQCASSGGLYQGGGTTCGSPPCPKPVGACCLADGNCLDGLTSAECSGEGGAYQGDGTSCLFTQCPLPTGACCLPSGPPRIPGGGCVDDLTYDQCVSQSGLYQGDGATCASAPCPAAEGACCLVDDSCVPASADDCANQGGFYQGDLTDCGEFNDCGYGACCFPDGGCVIADADSCMSYAGSFSGPRTLCEPNPCSVPTGACCAGLPRGDGGSCSIQTYDDCLAGGGEYQGDGVGCQPSPCDAGACCYLDGACETLTEAECADASGSFQGVGMACESVTCVEGACCLSDGACIFTSPTACTLSGGAYLGDATLCDSSSCVRGACCLPGGGCIEGSLADCSAGGGSYQGDWTTCVDFPCAVGACCLPNGGCAEQSVSLCGAAGGVHRGDGTNCDSAACQPAVGSCCLPEGFCQTSTRDECESGGGVYAGDGTSCGSTSCGGSCPTVPGDLDGGCAANGLDIDMFTDCLMSGSTSPVCACGDYDRDGLVTNGDMPQFVNELLGGGGGAPAAENPGGVIIVEELPSPDACPPDSPKNHRITATWVSIQCGLENIKIINQTGNVTLADETYQNCPTVMTVTVDAMLGPNDVIQTTVLTCGPNPRHPCCTMAVTDEVTSCPIQGATYLSVADEARTEKEQRTLTCPGAPANSGWSRDKLGEGDVSPESAAGATYQITAERESKPVDDVAINRSHTDGDGDKSHSGSKLTVLALDLKIHKPKAIDTAEPAVADADELNVGVQTFVNLDNDDDDQLWDTKGTEEDRDVAGEDEMCKIRVRIKPKDLRNPCGKAKLEATAGGDKVKLWTKANKDTEYTLASDINVPADFTVVGDWLEKTFWVEGRVPSGAQRDVKLKLTYDQAPNFSDEVALTIIGIEKIEWLGRGNSLTDSDELDANPDPNWPSGLNPGSVRVFPDARATGTPPRVEADPRDKVDVKVTLTVKPIAAVPIFFRAFDVDDPTSAKKPVDDTSGDELTEEDNRGTTPARQGQFVKNDGSGDETDGIKTQEFSETTATFRFRVTMQPGDNFRIVGNGDKDALPDLENKDSDYKDNNQDKQRIVNKTVKTSAAEREVRDPDNYCSNRVLCVWRRMHVEQDSMAAFPAAPEAQSNYIDRRIDEISGNGTVARRIDVTADIPVQVDTDGDGTADTDDNSETLTTDNGRFEGGFVQIGTTPVRTDNINGNGVRYARKRDASDANVGFDIPATVSKAGQTDASGQVVALTGRVFTLRITAGTLVAAHNGGTLTVCGVAMNIAAVNAATSRVTVNADPNITIRLHDDDDDANGTYGLPTGLRTGYMSDADAVADNLYAAAFIRPKFNGGGNTDNNTRDVPPVLNTEFSGVYRWDSRANNSERYWVVYLLTGWQDSYNKLRADLDPNSESGTGGTLGADNSTGTIVFSETIRERAPTAGGGGEALERRIVCHEVGHQMTLNHGARPSVNSYTDNGIMNGSNQGDPGADQKFIDRHLDQMRRLPRPR